ncbi:MAG: hypothetical protein K6L73_04510 [Cellvibrionaceae bacterium]
MQQSLIISLMAPDRPGIVETIADTVSNEGGNWLDSRMARLNGQFAGIIHINVEQSQSDSLKAALESLSDKGITLLVTNESATTQSNQQRFMHIKVVGNDRPGIVKEISSTIASCGANMEELATYLGSIPGSGEPLFHAEGLIALPEALEVDDLCEKLEAISDDLMIEIGAPEAANQ